MSSTPSSSNSRAAMVACSTVSRCTREEVEAILKRRYAYSQLEGPWCGYGTRSVQIDE